MKIYQTQDIRNIALVGGAKSGKTSMAEAMAFCGGLINRRGSVDSKNTISDYRDIEHDRGYSVENTLMYTEFGGKKINILDVPGFADYQGELDSALNVVEAAVVVVNAQSGVEVGTEIANRYAAKLDTPMLFVVNHLDAEKANFDDTVNQLKDYFGGKCTVLQFPTNAGLGFNQVVDIVANKMYTFTDGKSTEADIPAEYADKAEEMRMALVEEAAAADDALMEKYFENGDLTAEELTLPHPLHQRQGELRRQPSARVHLPERPRPLRGGRCQEDQRRQGAEVQQRQPHRGLRFQERQG